MVNFVKTLFPILRAVVFALIPVSAAAMALVRKDHVDTQVSVSADGMLQTLTLPSLEESNDLTDSEQSGMVGVTSMLAELQGMMLTELSEMMKAGLHPNTTGIRSIKDMVSNITSDLKVTRDDQAREVKMNLEAIDECNSNAVQQTNQIKTSTEKDVTTDRKAHAHCREMEKGKHATKVANCTDLDRYLRQLYVPAHEPASKERDAMVKYVEAMNEYYCPKGPEVTALEEACKEAEEAHKEHKDVCDRSQAKFESAFCTWRTQLVDACSTLTKCYKSAVVMYNEHVATTKELVAKWKVEYAALQKILCYVEVWLNDNNVETADAKVLSKCGGSTVDTSVLDIDFGTPPGQATCSVTPVAKYPGSKDFPTAEYSEFEDFVAKVIPCVGEELSRTCWCHHGTPLAGDACLEGQKEAQSNGVCASCKNGYYLFKYGCHPSENCWCHHGTPASGKTCAMHQIEHNSKGICAACNAGYTLRGGGCHPGAEAGTTTEGWTTTTRAPTTTTQQQAAMSTKWVVGTKGKHEGKDCNTVCQDSGSTCAGDTFAHPPKTADAMKAVGTEAGFNCDLNYDRCDMGEAPLIGGTNTCNFCGKPESYHHKCGNKWGDRIRFCPCKANANEAMYVISPTNTQCSGDLTTITSEDECKTAAAAVQGGDWDGVRNWADRGFGCQWTLGDGDVNFNTNANGKFQHSHQVPLCKKADKAANLQWQTDNSWYTVDGHAVTRTSPKSWYWRTIALGPLLDSGVHNAEFKVEASNGCNQAPGCSLAFGAIKEDYDLGQSSCTHSSVSGYNCQNGKGYELLGNKWGKSIWQTCSNDGIQVGDKVQLKLDMSAKTLTASLNGKQCKQWTGLPSKMRFAISTERAGDKIAALGLS